MIAWLNFCTFMTCTWLVWELYMMNIRRHTLMITAKKKRYKNVRLQTIAMWQTRLIRGVGLSIIAMIMLFFVRYYLYFVWLQILGWLLLLLTLVVNFGIKRHLNMLDEMNEDYWKYQKLPEGKQR